jgi:citrate synthase
LAEQIARGLEDVVVGESTICFIDGREGRLLYQGYDIHDLAEHATFEEVVYLLWHGRLPTQAELDELTAAVNREAELPAPVLDMMRQLPKDSKPMTVLRTAVSMLALYDPEADDMSRAANERKSVRLLGRIATIVAAWERIRNGQEPLRPQPGVGLARNFLYMLKGQEPDDEDARMFDVCLTLHADHELNASTFSAMVTAATLSDMYSAITSAIGTLKGPLHGGANEQVMRMLLEIGEPEKAEAWVKAALQQKKKIMGFGHRVYRTEDPRATHLRAFSRRQGEKHGELKWYEMSRIIEDTVKREKGLYPNVDFYSASTYYLLGIPIDQFTPVFAVSRISGWTAHVLEQYADNRLIRPRAEYVGPTRLTWVPISERKGA